MPASLPDSQASEGYEMRSNTVLQALARQTDEELMRRCGKER